MTEKDSTGSAVEPQTLIESADQSPKRADYAEWIDWTTALAEWVLNQHVLGKMSMSVRRDN
jgi:hypothetical protein